MHAQNHDVAAPYIHSVEMMILDWQNTQNINIKNYVEALRNYGVLKAPSEIIHTYRQ